MASKLVDPYISSYTVSKFTRFLRHSVYLGYCYHAVSPSLDSFKRHLKTHYFASP